MRVIQGVINAGLTNRERAILRESRANLRSKLIQFNPNQSTLISDIGRLNKSSNHYRFAIKRRLPGLGDVIMSTVALRGLKEKFPNCKINYVTDIYTWNGSLAKILKYNPYIDQVIKISDFYEADYDYWADITTIDIQMETRNPMHRIDIYCQYLGVSPLNKTPIYTVSPQEKEAAKQLISSYFKEKRPLIFINPGSNADRRNITEESLNDLFKLLVKEYNVIASHHFKRAGIDSPYLLYHVNNEIREGVALMNECNVTVAHDTSILHLAGALEKNIVALFGSIEPLTRVKYYRHTNIIYNKGACDVMPCLYRPCHKNFVCIRSITGQQILNEIKKFS